MQRFIFDLQLFAVSVLKDKMATTKVKAGETVEFSIPIKNGKKTFYVKHAVVNKSKSVLYLELYNFVPNVMKWLGNPGSGGYAEFVSYASNGKRTGSMRYMAVNDSGSYVERTITEKTKKVVTYAIKSEYENYYNGIIGYAYKPLAKFDNDDETKIKKAKSLVGVTLTKITDLDFSKAGASAAYYSLGITPKNNGHGGDAKASTKVTVNNFKPDSRDPGLKGTVVNKNNAPYFRANREAYLKVSANTSNGVSTLQVNVMYGNAKGKLANSPEHWNGTLNLSGVKNAEAGTYNEKYATLKYAKPAYYPKASKKAKNVKTAWKLNVTDAAIGSVFTGLGKNDYVDTAATGEEGAELKTGTYTIYNKKKSGSKYVQEKRTLTVKGTVKVQTDENGKLAGVSDVDAGEKVTWKDGRKTTTYAYNGITNTFTGAKTNDIIHCTGNKDIFKVDVKKNSGKDKVYDFAVGDVIQMNNLSKKDISALKGGNLTGRLAQGFKFSSGGTLTVSTGETLKFDAKNKQITVK